MCGNVFADRCSTTSYYSKMANVLTVLAMFLFKWCFIIYYGFLMSIGMMLDIIRNGPRTFFHQKPREFRPECMNNPALGEHGYLNLKKVGIRLHYVAAGDQNKPLMLFLHGFPECWYSWRHQMKAFKKDYRVVAIDLRGYGESDIPSGVLNYTIKILIDDVREVIEELGYSSCILVAHDWGGAIAWHFAMEYPDIVDKLIVNNVGHPKRFQEHIKSHWSQFRKSWYMFFFQLPYLPEIMLCAKDLDFLNACFISGKAGIRSTGMFTTTDLEALKFSFSHKGTVTAAINYYRAAFQTKPMKSKRITCPTILIWGDQDVVLEVGIAKGTEKYVDNFTLKIVEGASHWVQQDRPDEVNRLMNEFLKE